MEIRLTAFGEVITNRYETNELGEVTEHIVIDKAPTRSISETQRLRLVQNWENEKVL